MGSLSILHWLLILAVVGFFILLVRVLLRPNRVTRWMMRLAERRYFRAPAQDIETIAEQRALQSPLRSIDMAVAAAFSLALFVLLFVVARNRIEPGYALILQIFQLILNFAVPLLVIAAVLLHFTPNVNRVLKYRVLLGLAYLGPTLFAANVMDRLIFVDFGKPDYTRFGQLRFEPESPLANEPLVWAAYLIWCAAPFAVAILSARRFTRAYFEAVPPRQAPAKLRAAYRRAVSLGATLLMYVTLQFGIAPFFLLRRFFIAERMARTPIVFLRSFQHRNSTNLFGRVIAKVASRHSVVVGIAHSTQTIGDLSSETSMLQQAQLVTVSDRQWQDWIKAQLSRARAIIIERSIGTGGVRWEIDTALSTVEPFRIALLNEKGAPRIEVPNVYQLEYELTTGVRQARAALDQWLTGIDRAESMAPVPSLVGP